MELATVNSDAEVNEFIKQGRTHSCHNLKLNFLQLTPYQYSYKTIDGDTFPIPYDQVPWAPGKPDAKGEQCVVLVPSLGTFDDVPCNLPNYGGCFMCTEDFVSTPTAAPTVSPTSTPTTALPTSTPTFSPTASPTAETVTDCE